MRTGALVCAVVLISTASPARPQEADGPDSARRLPARITEDRTLEGVWHMDSDVIVERGATLRLRPGTTIVVGADSAGKGVSSAQCEFYVGGRISCAGTADAPVRFTGSDWFGIVLREDRNLEPPDSEFRHLHVHRAVFGLTVSTGAPTIDHCVFHSCNVGLAVGNLRSGNLRVSHWAKAPAPEVSSSLFVNCRTGVFVERDATPEIRRTTFIGNTLGIGNSAPWGAYQIRGYGPRVQRCLFTGNRTAVQGSSIVENTLFVQNQLVHGVSEFHGTYAAQEDRIAWRRNVLHANGRVAAGESDLGHDTVAADPRLVELPTAPAFESAVTPPPGAALREDSTVVGTATDGGDPGPLGRPGLGGNARPWTSTGLKLGAAYVGRSVGQDSSARSALKAGGLLLSGGVTWARFPRDTDGSIHVGPIQPEDGLRLYASFPFSAVRAGSIELEVNADGAVQAWLNGARLGGLPDRVRYGSAGVVLPAKVVAGENEVVVSWVPSEPFHRVGVGIHGGAEEQVETLVLPAPEPQPLGAVAVAYRRPTIGFRLPDNLHWADLLDRERAHVLRPDGERVSLGDLSPEFAARGFVKATVPTGWSDEKLVFRFRRVRDPHGRVLPGQPLDLPLESR